LIEAQLKKFSSNYCVINVQTYDVLDIYILG